ncbi:hypothetical protein [Tetragenococcus muriaticus]|uniref:hypothetical protein n=1 Tax=Tetragenococcus muriaticus TaxID=64642 RepID=UPI00041A4A17|nr:hypothetical protein [Tetragenococcus muriaticus]GMA45861.1 hypothetical protein GCM10025854_01080 [Tetragenococcus muriaticus]GMA45924.1 hypothetical protein GCM10025854_01720 [Tetragenococcus muriaticus]GMA46297.1 hypothetical protein GCM10025854_05460 [Tetragenococcus muriaticus]
MKKSIGSVLSFLNREKDQINYCPNESDYGTNSLIAQQDISANVLFIIIPKKLLTLNLSDKDYNNPVLLSTRDKETKPYLETLSELRKHTNDATEILPGTIAMDFIEPCKKFNDGSHYWISIQFGN